jgi:hypothetical protein
MGQELWVSIQASQWPPDSDCYLRIQGFFFASLTLLSNCNVDTMQAAMDILEKEGAATADRPRKIAGGEIRSGDMRILLVGVGERLKKLRRCVRFCRCCLRTVLVNIFIQCSPYEPTVTSG